MDHTIQDFAGVAGPKRISTRYSWGLKVAPFMFLGFIGFFFALVAVNGGMQKAPVFLVVLGVMVVLGYRSWQTTIRNLADEVDDCGSYLVVRRGGEEDTVMLSNIVNVNFTSDRRGAAPRITLFLEAPGKFGPQIMFAPPAKFFSSSSRDALAQELRVRAARARSGSAAS